MPPSVASAWTRIGTSVLLIATALGSGFVAASPATAAPPMSVNCSTLVGSVSTDDSFNAAVDKVNAGLCNIITITNSIYLATQKTIDADMVTSLTITGNPDDSTLTSAPRQGVVIKTDDTPVTTNLNLTVSNLTFSGFDDSRIGGTASALTAESLAGLTVSLTNVSFINNFGREAPGAANLSAGGSANITINGYSNFQGNRSALALGGAIRIGAGAGSTVTIGSPGDDSVSFLSNTSLAQSGGAIAVTCCGTNHQLTTHGGTFADDSAAWAGGAISTVGSATLNNTDFTNNTASGDVAGAVYAGGSVVVNGGTFHGNHAGGAGGAVSASGDTTISEITNATFTNNSAGGHGGAVRALGLLTITGSTFRDDSAALSGGAIAADDTITITGSVFQDDTATGSGGAVISIYASVITQNSTYRTNRARDSGGAISAANRVTSTDDTFAGNLTTLYDGGAIRGGQVTTTTSRFTGNRVQRNGGAIAAASLDDSGSTFIGNRSGDRGGAVDLSQSSTFTGSTFRDDSAVQGGAIFSFGPLTVTNSLFEDDTAADSGGSIVVNDTLSVVSSTFRRNVALNSGGAIVANSTVNVVDSFFEDNEARGPSYLSNGYGGAIASGGSAANTTLTRTTFTGNRAQHEGGAISANGTVTLTDDTFTNNSSVNAEGGALHVAAPGMVVATRTSFTSNTSGSDGGAIRVDGTATLTSSTLELNRATNAGKNGGGVAATGNVTVTSSEFSGNSSTQWGGAVATFGSATVTDSTFDANTTLNSGGALWIDDTATVTRSTFTDDTSAQLGGAISAGDLVMRSSSLSGNQSGFNGGAVFVNRAGDVSNSTFVNNYGGFGGALAFNDPAAASRVAFSTLIGNAAPATQGTAINAPNSTPISLTGSVLAGASPLCRDEGNGTDLNLTSHSSYSFATDTSCGGGDESTSIKTRYTTDDSLGVASAITTDDTPGWQVVIPDDTAVGNAYVPLSVLPIITTDQLNGLRNSPNGLTSAGAVQVRPTSMTGPASVTVAPGANATFSVTGYPGIGPTITYQWQSSTDGTTWSNVSGAQTSTLTLPSVTQSQSGLQVRVLVADAYGNDDTSTTATLTVTTPTPGPGPGPGPTPTPTPTPAPSPTPAPIPSPIPPGGALLQVDGRTVPVDVQPRPGDAGLRVQGEGWDMTLDGLDRAGRPLGVNPQGALVTDIGSGVRMGGSGFQPGSKIGFFLDPPVAPSTSTAYRANSATTDLGDITINADGRYSAIIEMPDTIAPGAHVLQAVGVGTSGERRVLSLGVVVDAWIDLKRGKRTPSGRFDQVRATGMTGGLPAGAVLTPWVRSPGQDAFRRGTASITVRADGTFAWTRKVQKSKGLTAYVSYRGTDSDKVYWARLR